MEVLGRSQLDDFVEVNVYLFLKRVDIVFPSSFETIKPDM